MKSLPPFAYAVVAVAVLSSPGAVESFAPRPSSQRVAFAPDASPFRGVPTRRFASEEGSAGGDRRSDDAVDGPRRSRLFPLLSPAVRRKSRPVALALLAAATTLFPGGRTTGGAASFLRPPTAHAASAPMVLRPSLKKPDSPTEVALKQADEIRRARSLEEHALYIARCNGIEKSEGREARDAFEERHRVDGERERARRGEEAEALRRDMLDGGRDPHTDLDAERELFALEHEGVDLEKVPGTPQNDRMILNFRERARRHRKGGDAGDDASALLKGEKQRYIVACQVADLKARGVDPLAHFARGEVAEKTRAIYKMDDDVAARVASQYQALMEKYDGRLTPAEEGEVPFARPDSAADTPTEVAAMPGPGPRARRAAARRAARGRRAADRAAARKDGAAAKAGRKAGKKAAKVRRRSEKVAAAAASAAAEEAASALDAPAAAAGPAADAVVAQPPAELAPPVAQQQSIAAAAENEADGIASQIKTLATPRNTATVLLGGGAIAYGVNYYGENSGAAQKERERQLKLILGDLDEDDDDDEFDDDEDDEYEQFTKEKNAEPPTRSEPKADDAPEAAEKRKAPPAPAPPTPAAKPKKKKKRLGIFSKRNADLRETDLRALVRPDALAPEFASLLARVLTFGAPGRFPDVASWGDAPLDEFDPDAAKSLLAGARADAGLADEQSAEIFASVVNCMIIDIVDLASTTLKGKNQEEKVTVDAINVVMDFMDHAASLFDAVAKDVTIKPVTYGGKLRKKDLEQMFSVYAGSSMMSLDAIAGGGGGATQDRVDTLQLVFAITDKKAEGLMQKHMMKMMMNLMKDGGKGGEGMPGMEGMEGMEEMMAAMGGGGGMPGMPGMPGADGGDLSPEDLKQTLGMMKDLMESGQVSEEEIKEIRGQFKEMYGSDISDLIKKATDEGAEAGMTSDEKELMDMFKLILGDE